MKNSLAVVVLLLVVSSLSFSQFKSQVPQETQVAGERLGGSSSPLSYLFGWFNPDKFTMRHSFDLSYASFGGQGLSLGTYTNSMSYEITDNLNARADVALSFSPYNSLGTGSKNNFSGIYLKNAELNYKPWDNTYVSLSFHQVPYGSSLYYSPFSSPFSRLSGF